MMYRWRASLGLTLAASVLAGIPAAAQDRSGIEVVSSRPDMVTGGDALIRVAADAAPTVTLDGTAISATFEADGEGNWVGLVEGLPEGESTLAVEGGKSLALVNHGLNATLFAGPQQTPFICENEEHGLPAATDERCSVPAQEAYFYRSTDGSWKPFDPDGTRPGDIETTTTSEGNTVPLIVWTELGVINRSAYAIGMLHDPAEGPLPTPTTDTPGWNGKLIYSHRGGVRPAYHMGRDIGTMDPDRGYVGGENNNLHESLIQRGFAFAGGSLSVTGTTTNHVLQAETTAKIKERFIELFGPPTYTVSMGTSGGSMSQHLIAQNYPGLYDGIMPWRSYPDVITFQLPLYDCQLLAHYFEGKEDWTRLQKTEVSGKLDFNYCVVPAARFPNLDPTNCDPSVTATREFDLENPQWANVRCTYQDNLVNVYGTVPAEGALNAFGEPVEEVARNYWDNVGVQYGLEALNKGVITFEQFVDLNRHIGGYDVNGDFGAERSVGDEEALRIAHETGRINRGQGGLAEMPILDIRGYTDGTCTRVACPPGDPTDIDVHDGYHTLLTRERLIEANGNAENHVRIVTTEVDHREADSVLAQASVEAFDLFDQWVTAVVSDSSDMAEAEKVRAHRPAELVDACYTSAENKITDMELCGTLFPIGSDPRMEAGAPPTNDILKCQLKEIDPTDYPSEVSAEQLDELREVFTGGVCDWSQPSVGAVPLAGTWLRFQGDAQFDTASADQ